MAAGKLGARGRTPERKYPQELVERVVLDYSVDMCLGYSRRMECMRRLADKNGLSIDEIHYIIHTYPLESILCRRHR